MGDFLSCTWQNRRLNSNNSNTNLYHLQSMQNLYQKVKNHFSRYTNADVVYIAGDTLFLSESAAMSYGTGAVKAIRRNNIESLNTENQNTSHSLTVEEIGAMTYSQLKSKVAEFGIVAEDMKKETLKDALLTFVK